MLLLYVSINIIFLVSKVKTQYCSNVPNGLERLRNGVDITKLDFLPLDVTTDNGFRTPIIDFKCAQKKKTTIAGKVYDVPDEIISIDNIPSGWLDAEINIYKTSSDITKEMSVNADVGILGGLFSASGSYKKMQHTITNTSKYIEDASAYVSARKVNVFPYWGLTLSSAASIYVERYLPPNIEDNVIAYKQFIQYFGTHFLQYGKYGGLIRLVLSTDKNYYYGRTTRDVKAQAKASFFKIIKAGGGGGGSTQKIDTKFTSATSKQVRYYGGDTNLLAKDNGIPFWQPTVSKNPWLFAGKLVPVSVFFTDKAKRKSIERAIEIHLDMAYLQELQRLLYSFKAKPFLQGKVTILQDKVKSLLSKQMPSHKNVEQLGYEIKDNIVAPDWYKQEIKLCYRWYPDGDGGQCGGGASRLLCATPGSMTPYYRDDTDGRGGGCRMSWGIMHQMVVPSWFNQVQICYKWWPDGDGGQCGGGASRSLCAKVGSYTPYYRDDTDGRGGGCRMQWKLVVPSSAPFWMQNAQLCFQWYADGDGGQCGGGASKYLCSNANEYTSPYRDDTDGRGGGCQMSWGIKI